MNPKPPMFYFTVLHRDKPDYKGFQLGLFGWYIEIKKCPDWRGLFSKFRGYNFIQIYSSLGFSMSFKWFKLKGIKPNGI